MIVKISSLKKAQSSLEYFLVAGVVFLGIVGAAFFCTGGDHPLKDGFRFHFEQCRDHMLGGGP